MKIEIEVSKKFVIEKMIAFLEGETDEYYYTKDCPYTPSAEYTEFLEQLKKAMLEAERDALQAEKKAYIDIYMDLHVSEMRGQPDHLRQAWSVGQELYIKKLEGEG